MTRLCAAILLAAALSTAAHLRAEKHAPFMIGVLSNTGVLDPLATFDGSRWHRSWPDRAPLPKSIAAIPPRWWGGFSASGWRVALPDGERLLRIRTPIHGDSSCGEGVALMTDYVHPSPLNGLNSLVGIAATGPVVIRSVKTIERRGQDAPSDPDWAAGEQKLGDLLRTLNRPADRLEMQLVARIPRASQADVWEIEATGPHRLVRAWYSDAATDHFILFSDAWPVEYQDEILGSLRPFGAIWDLDGLTVLAWQQGYDGGEFVVLRITMDGMTYVATVGGFGC